MKVIAECCPDFTICIEDYKKITLKTDIVRFSGSVINFCPFCGTKIMIVEEEK